jgi:hypothetical protein
MGNWSCLSSHVLWLDEYTLEKEMPFLYFKKLPPLPVQSSFVSLGFGRRCHSPPAKICRWPNSSYKIGSVFI